MFMSDQHKNTSGTTLDASLDISTHFTLYSSHLSNGSLF